LPLFYAAVDLLFVAYSPYFLEGISMPNVLIIEDDLEQSQMLSEYLTAMNLNVISRDLGLAGIHTVREQNIDIVVLDIGLPDMDGFEVCRQMRSFSQVPILILTARGDEMDRIIGLEIGADDYLAKPFNPRELLARINAILRRGTQSLAEASNCFGRLEIFPDSRTASLSGKTIALTGYQFDILFFFSTHAGRVLSRDQLMDALQGHDIEPFDRSIDVHISRIRSLIEDNPKQPQRILTIRGVGYVFAKQQD